MQKKIIYTISGLLIILIIFFIYQKISTSKYTEIIYDCETWKTGDPPLHFEPVETTDPRYTEMKNTCEERGMCQWINIKDNIKDSFYTCIRE